MAYQKLPQRDFSRDETINIWRAAQISLSRLQYLCTKQNPFVSDKQFGRCTLIWAAISGNVQTFDFLINVKKFDPWKEDIFGFNCFHYLACNPNNPINKIIKFDFKKNILSNHSQQLDKKQAECYEVLIIGAGAAGIGAGVTLARKGVKLAILEARDRLGGRIISASVNGVQMDLGACWVHSYNKNNPICKQVKCLHWKSKKCPGEITNPDMMSEHCKGSISRQDLGECSMYNQNYFLAADTVAQKSIKDISIEQAGRQYYEKVIAQLPKHKKAIVDMLINMTEHYEASPISELSAKHYQDKDDYGGDFSPEGSYSKLLLAIAKSCKLQEKVRFNTIVKDIIYENGPEQACKVVCQDGQVYYAKKVISSLPLGLLKKQTVKFSPSLPKDKLHIIQNLSFGLMNKVIMSFSKPFWKDHPSWIRIASQQKDNFAKKVSTQSDEQIISSLMQLLCKVYQLKELKPAEYIITRWDQDPFSLGSYSSFGVNSCLEDTKILRKHINEKLWIVGEHCYGEHIGCAHGAFQTGVWAAQEILSKLKYIDYNHKK